MWREARGEEARCGVPGMGGAHKGSRETSGRKNGATRFNSLRYAPWSPPRSVFQVILMQEDAGSFKNVFADVLGICRINLVWRGGANRTLAPRCGREDGAPSGTRTGHRSEVYEG